MDQTVRHVKKNIFFTIASILVFNEKNQLLMLRRSEWKDIPGQDYRPDLSHAPDLPGGIVGDEGDEPERDGAVRELEEETGIKINADDLDLVYAETDLKSEVGHSKTILMYVLRLDYTPEVDLSWEHESFEWRDPADIVRSGDLKNIRGRGLSYVLDHPEIFKI